MREDPRKLAEYKARCGYRKPPAEVEPLPGVTLGHQQWRDLADWFEANTDDWNESLLVYIAERFDETIGDAYVATDGFAKARLGRHGFN